MVSDTISLPSRGTFHLSLTVLVRYRSHGNIQAYPTVWTDSRGIPRVPRYLGEHIDGPGAAGYGAITLYGREFNPVRLTPDFITAAGLVGTRTTLPTTPRTQPPTGITRTRFSHHPLSLATTHGISFPAGTEMFHFPAYPPHECGDSPQRLPGFPIRTPSDQSLVGGSPRPIAAPHVLHRSRVPRHPPYALQDNTQHTSIACARRTQRTSGQHIITQMITKRSTEPHEKTTWPDEKSQQATPPEGDMTCSRPLSSSQTTTPQPAGQHPTRECRPDRPRTRNHPPGKTPGVAVREPNSASHTPKNRP